MIQEHKIMSTPLIHLTFDLVRMLEDEIEIRDDELIHSAGGVLTLHTHVYGLPEVLRLKPHFAKTDARHQGLGVLFDRVARHRRLKTEDGTSPRAADMGISRITRDILGDDLQDAIDAAWQVYLRHDLNAAHSLMTWRSTGRPPTGMGQIRSPQAEMLEVDTSMSRYWMSGIIGLERFEVTTLVDPGGKVMMRFDEGGARMRVNSLPETMITSLPGRRLAEVVDSGFLRGLDIVVGPRTRATRTVVHHLRGDDLIPRDLAPLLDIEPLGDELAARCPRSIDAARRIIAMRGPAPV